MPAPPSREQLLHLLAEAAELEHNLLCSNLFALFRIKASAEKDLAPHERGVVQRWRKELLAVRVEEMTRFAQMANLTVALGFPPHIDRPNLPVAVGRHPAAVVVELTRFDLDTLDHLIFLERPEGARGHREGDIHHHEGFLRGGRRTHRVAGHRPQQWHPRLDALCHAARGGGRGAERGGVALAARAAARHPTCGAGPRAQRRGDAAARRHTTRSTLNWAA